MSTQVYAFAQIHDEPERKLVYDEIFRGKSRFGRWDQMGSLRDHHHGKNAGLLRIKPGDWIVHINMPHYGHCVAVQSVGDYVYDEGLECSWGRDFNNVIPNNPDTIVEFNRNDRNVLTSVNLSPLKRLQRVLQVDDFLKSLENLRTQKHSDAEFSERHLIHLKDRMNGLLPQITEAIQAMNRSKRFEDFLHRVFRKTARSIQNGYGWRSDNGADLIVEYDDPILGDLLSSRVVVQAKSYTGNHYDLKGVDQIVEAMNVYDADAGLLITTANSTTYLEKYIEEQAEKAGKPIKLIAGDEVARFVLQRAPELLVG